MAQGADRSVASVGAARQRARWGRVRALEVRISRLRAAQVRVLAEYGRAAAAPTTGSAVRLVSLVEELDGAEEELAVAMTWTDYPRAQVVVRAVADLDDAQAGAVDTAVADRIPMLTTGQVRDL